jgi:hypothetical protein
MTTRIGTVLVAVAAGVGVAVTTSQPVAATPAVACG